MKKGKGEKVKIDEADCLNWYGAMKDSIKINGNIYSTGAWPSDEELVASYDEQATDIEAGGGTGFGFEPTESAGA